MGPIARPQGRPVQVTVIMRGTKCLGKAVTEKREDRSLHVRQYNIPVIHPLVQQINRALCPRTNYARETQKTAQKET